MDKCTCVSIQGGGSKGLMCIGMIMALDDHLPLKLKRSRSEYFNQIKMFSGCSVGSMVALMLLVNIETAFIREVLQPILSSSHSILPNPDISNLINNFGLDDARAIRWIVYKTLRSAGMCDDATFRDIERLLHKKFTCVATDLKSKRPVYFSADDTPDVKVADAIIMSCTLPFIFSPMKHKGHVMVDGCLSHLMPRNTILEETLFIEFGETTEPDEINSLNDYIYSILRMTVERTDGSWYRDRPHITLQLPSSMDLNAFRDFSSMDDTRLNAIVKAGYASTMMFLYSNYISTIEAVIYMVYETILQQYCCSELGPEAHNCS